MPQIILKAEQWFNNSSTLCSKTVKYFIIYLYQVEEERIWGVRKAKERDAEASAEATQDDGSVALGLLATGQLTAREDPGVNS